MNINKTYVLRKHMANGVMAVDHYNPSWNDGCDDYVSVRDTFGKLSDSRSFDSEFDTNVDSIYTAIFKMTFLDIREFNVLRKKFIKRLRILISDEIAQKNNTYMLECYRLFRLVLSIQANYVLSIYSNINIFSEINNILKKFLDETRWVCEIETDDIESTVLVFSEGITETVKGLYKKIYTADYSDMDYILFISLYLRHKLYIANGLKKAPVGVFTNRANLITCPYKHYIMTSQGNNFSKKNTAVDIFNYYFSNAYITRCDPNMFYLFNINQMPLMCCKNKTELFSCYGAPVLPCIDVDVVTHSPNYFSPYVQSKFDKTEYSRNL